MVLPVIKKQILNDLDQLSPEMQRRAADLVSFHLCRRALSALTSSASPAHWMASPLAKCARRLSRVASAWT
jgi:hypothetical protein